MRFEQHVNGYLCAFCVEFWFWQYTRHNLVLGWWGPMSAFLTVAWTIGNVWNYARARAKFRKL